MNWARPALTSPHPSEVSDMATKKKDKQERHHAEAEAPQAGDGPAPKMKTKQYELEMRVLHGELVAMQEWVKASGAKICIVFEGRDTAGKGGTIKRITERVSPRVFRVVALPAPTEREKSQMYIQRYLPHFPAPAVGREKRPQAGRPFHSAGLRVGRNRFEGARPPGRPTAEVREGRRGRRAGSGPAVDAAVVRNPAPGSPAVSAIGPRPACRG